MRNLLFITCLLLTVNAQAQFQKTETPKETSIGKAKAGGIKFAELYYYITNETDTSYRLFYKDMRYSALESWESVYLKGGSESLAGLYNALMEAIAADKGAESTFKMNETGVLVKTEKSLGTKFLYVVFDGSGGGLMQLTEKHINSLFGK